MTNPTDLARTGRATARSLARELLGASATKEEACDALARALVPSVATWCEVCLADPDGDLRRVAVRAAEDRASTEIVDAFPDLARRRDSVLATGESEVLRDEAGRACLLVAVRDARDPLGTVAVVGDVPDLELADHVGLVEHLATLAGALIGRDLLRRHGLDAARRSQRVASQLHQLLAASIAIGGLQDEDEILASVAQRVRGVFDGELAVVTVSAGDASNAVVSAETGRTQRIEPANAVEEFGFPAEALAPVAAGVAGTWLFAPILLRRGEAQGSLGVRRARGGFEDDDVEVATLLAQTAASALASARLHRTVARSEERLRVLVDAAPVAIVETDNDGAVRWWNRAAQVLFAWGVADEAAREPAVPRFPGDAGAALGGIWAEALGGVAVVGRDLSGIETGGRRRDLTVSVAVLPATEERRSSLLTVVEDVTDHRQLMEELRHAQRMDVIGQLASSIAHDFNNLLTLISGYAELLSAELGDDGRTGQLVGDIQATTARASTLTGKLLTMGRTRAPSPVTFSPVHSIRALGEVLDRIVGKDVRLELELDDRAGNVRADPEQFDQTIMNLATNARDAMPGGGTLRISVSPTAGDPQAVRIVVADTGEGMDEATLQRCFEPLFTTKGPSRGTGLGLPAARRVVTEAGGTILCRSTLGEGTTFEIELPSVPDDVDVAPLPEPVQPARSTATVLLAEDEDGIRQLIVQVLVRNGFTVLEAENGEHALEVAQSLDRGVDLLVSDVVMGGLSGRELAAQLQSRWPGLLVVLVSGNVDESVLEDLRPGSAAFLSKPFRPSELLDVIVSLLARGGDAAVAPGQ